MLDFDIMALALATGGRAAIPAWRRKPSAVLRRNRGPAPSGSTESLLSRVGSKMVRISLWALSPVESSISTHAHHAVP